MGESQQFQSWAKLVAAELITGESVEQRVERDLTREKIRTEVHDENGRWVETKELDA